MANLGTLTITNKGQELITSILAGTETGVKFTHVSSSSKEYADSDLESLEALEDIKQTIEPSSITAVSGNTVMVDAIFSNKNLTEGYDLNTIGLYATPSDGTEILYAVCRETTGTLAVPAYNGVTSTDLVVDLYTLCGNSENISLEISEAAVASAKALTAHIDSAVASEDGVHGLRYYDDKFQIKNASGEWTDAESGTGIAPSNVSGLKIKIGNQKLTVFWSDPGDTVVEGQTLCTWKGTKLVQKAGSFPENAKDGTILVDNQTLDAYKTSGYEINNLTNGQTYYFGLFPYSDKNAVNVNSANMISGTPQPYRTMTAVIDLSNSNPATCVTYSDDAESMTAGSSDWDDFFGEYPVLLKNGKEVGKLNRDNFDQFEDGTTADISSGDAGDAMIAFPRRGLKISTADLKVTISMTDDPDNSDFEYNAHTRGTASKDVFYLGVYKGYVASSKLRSLKGKTITANQTISTFRTQAQANGTGYEQSGFYQLLFRQCMYILKYKNLDSQSTVGQGYVASGHSAAIATGGSEAYGMDSEIIKASNPTYMTDQQHHVKCLGLEDFWGNIWEWIDGLVTDSSRNILTGNDSFNDSGSGYTNNGNGGVTSNIGNYLSVPQGNTKTGFVAKTVSGSATTYFCDCAYLYASCVAGFGGGWSDAAIAGAFALSVRNAASVSDAGIAARLMYL